MKKNLLFKVAAVILTIVAFSTGCSKDDEPQGAGNVQKLSFNSEEVLTLVPEALKNSTDPMALQCYSQVQTALNMSEFSSFMVVPDNATKLKSDNGTWTWSYSYDGVTWTYYWTYEEKEGKRYWEIDIQFGSGERSNFITAWETLDGKEGDLLYNFDWALLASGEPVEESDLLYYRYHWKQDSLGNYEFRFVWDSDSPEHDYFYEYVVNVNLDGSGNVKVNFMGEPNYYMTWDALGNGTWVYYSDGEVFDSGFWTV